MQIKVKFSLGNRLFCKFENLFSLFRTNQNMSINLYFFDKKTKISRGRF